MVCSRFWNNWPKASLIALDKGHSDHCPLILTLDSTDFGPKPFRFFNSWIDLPGFDDFVRNILKKETGNLKGLPDIILANKLRKVKEGLKQWVKDRKVEGKLEYNSTKEKVEKMELELEDGSITEDDLQRLYENRIHMLEMERQEVSDLKQQARIRWAMEGEENSKFFHGLINNRMCKSRLNGLNIDGTWCTSPRVIKEKVCSYFAKRFEESNKHQIRFQCEEIKRLSEEDRIAMESFFSKDDGGPTIEERALVFMEPKIV